MFEAAARTQSFARAAESLNMSAPAVSQQIRALETALGRPLFRRGPHSVALTPEGQALLPATSQALHMLEIATENVFGSPERAPLSVQGSLMMATSWLSARLPGFHAQAPGVNLTLTTGLETEDFIRSSADLKITFGQPQGIGEDGDPLFGEILYPVAPPGLADQIAEPGDLARFPLIEITGHRASWASLLPQGGRDPAMIHTDTTLMAFALAARGLGIALARSPASDAAEALYGLVPVLPGLSVKGVQAYALVYPDRARLSRAARSFREWLLDEAKRSGP